MNKKRLYLVLVGLAGIILFGVIAWLSEKKTDTNHVDWKGQDLEDLMLLLDDDNEMDSLFQNMAVTESFKTIDESIVPFLVPELCGYNPHDTRMGVITVRRDMDTAVFNRFFPRMDLRLGHVDTISGINLYIKPMGVFPAGECGRLAYIISNDTVIQIQFARTDMNEIVKDVSMQLDAVSGQLQELVKQMENDKKDR